MKRVFLFVLDSCGIGAMPDAEKFHDAGANTMKRIAASPYFKAEHLCDMGLGNIDGLSFLKQTETPLAAYARLAERSQGKDTTIGHWEIAGVVSPSPMPTYPDGFPPEILDAFSKATGRAVLCNRPYSGTDVIRDFGEEHLKTGALIVYTSADSVFQIAAHEKEVPVEQLYDYCQKAREILTGEHAVGRVIARPFIGEPGHFTRTANRRDFSLRPPKDTMLDALKKAGRDTLCIGKISDIFAGSGVTEKIPTHNNEEGMTAALQAARRDFHGLCFVNLVDFDMLYGHRQDVDGYANALAVFDRFLLKMVQELKPDDLLMITADHGCDPGDDSTDHTREYVPLIIYGKHIQPKNLGTRDTFADIAATVTEYLGVPFDGAGESVLSFIAKE